jgi:hypothetical protein
MIQNDIKPGEMDARQASATFNARVQEMLPQYGNDINRAWTAGKDLWPNLVAAFSGPPSSVLAGRKPDAVFSGSVGVIAGAVAPVNPYAGKGGAGRDMRSALAPAAPGQQRTFAIPNSGNIEALGLPTACSFEEFRAADVANGGASPRNSLLIWNGLLKLMQDGGDSADLEALRAKAATRYPALAAEIGYVPLAPT